MLSSAHLFCPHFALLAVVSCGGQLVGAAQDAQNDVAFDAGSDLATTANDFDADASLCPPTHCIGDLPAPPTYADPEPPLPGVSPKILWTQVIPSPYRQSYISMAVSGDHLGYVRGPVFYSIDFQGNLAGTFTSPDGANFDGPVGDALGHFYVTSKALYQLDLQAHLVGQFAPAYDATSDSGLTGLVTNIIVSPDQTLYFGQYPGKQFAVRASDLSQIWTVPEFTDPPDFAAESVSGFLFGMGDTLYDYDSVCPYLRTTGQVVGPSLRGVQLWAATLSNRIVAITMATTEAGEPTSTYTVMDNCYNVLWSLPIEPQTAPQLEVKLIGFHDEFLIKETNLPSEFPAPTYRYSQDGQVIAGPKTIEPMSILGADNSMYSISCQINSTPMVQAYDWTSLSYKWSESLPEAPSWLVDCAWTLADNGVMFVTYDVGTGEQIAAIQTTSPGLAKTAYPIWGSNNANSRWQNVYSTTTGDASAPIANE